MNNERKTYTVTLRFKYPAWDEREGYHYTVRATSKREAINQARHKAYDDGHTVGKGLDVIFTATEQVS